MRVGEVFLALNSAAHHSEDRQKRLSEEWLNIDGILGLLLLKTDIFDLKDLSFLPHVLERFRLHASWTALLYALGYEDELRNENAIPPDESPEDVVAFFDKWLTQPAAGDLPAAPEFLDKQTLELRSGVLGCDLVMSVPNKDDSLFLAEAILAGTEAFLATSLDSTFIPHASRIQIRVVPSDFLDEALEFTVKMAPHTVIEVRHRKENIRTAETTGDFKDKLVKLISTITAHIAMPRDVSRKQLESLIRDEAAFGCALLISGINTTTHNVLGERPKIRISDWTSEEGQKKKFPLLRQRAWNQGRAIDKQKGEEVPPTPGTGDPPPEVLDVERLKHRDRKVFSLFNVHLWNMAGWNGTGFATAEDPNEPPFLVLIFEDLAVATTIFKGWHDEIGHEDSEEKLRISIITGITADNPAAYRVILGSSPNRSTAAPNSQFVMTSRINTMNPSTRANLDRFLESYKKAQRYILVPGQFAPSGIGALAPALGILKRELIVRPAWQIGDHDPDTCGIEVTDNIIIPEGITDAPVHGTIARKKKKLEAESHFSPRSDTILEEHRKVGRNDPCYCGSGIKYKKCHGRYPPPL